MDEQQNGSGPGSQFLSSLADRFQKVADTGDLSQLNPSNQQSPSGTKGATSQQAYRGAHAHKHGSHSKDNTAFKQLMSSIFDEVNQAVSQ